MHVARFHDDTGGQNGRAHTAAENAAIAAYHRGCGLGLAMLAAADTVGPDNGHNRDDRGDAATVGRYAWMALHSKTQRNLGLVGHYPPESFL